MSESSLPRLPARRRAKQGKVLHAELLQFGLMFLALGYRFNAVHGSPVAQILPAGAHTAPFDTAPNPSILAGCRGEPRREGLRYRHIPHPMRRRGDP